jgi:hypothetical protein
VKPEKARSTGERLAIIAFVTIASCLLTLAWIIVFHTKLYWPPITFFLFFWFLWKSGKFGLIASVIVTLMPLVWLLWMLAFGHPIKG